MRRLTQQATLSDMSTPFGRFHLYIYIYTSLFALLVGLPIEHTYLSEPAVLTETSIRLGTCNTFLILVARKADASGEVRICEVIWEPDKPICSTWAVGRIRLPNPLTTVAACHNGSSASKPQVSPA